MKSTKCAQCGLVYWNTVANCKRCNLANPYFEGETPAAESQPETAYRAPVQNNYYAPQPAMPIAVDAQEQLWLKNLKSDSRLFYFIGGLQTLLWFFLGNLLIVDGALNIGLAFLAYKLRSRVAAIFLCILTVLSVMSAIVSFVTGGPISLNPLAVIILIGRLLCSVRMVYSTFMLRKHAVEHFVSPPPPPAFHPDGTPQWAPASSTQWQ